MKINQIIIKRKKNIDNDNLTTAVQQMNNKHVIEFTPFSVFFCNKNVPCVYVNVSAEENIY